MDVLAPYICQSGTDEFFRALLYVQQGAADDQSRRVQSTGSTIGQSARETDECLQRREVTRVGVGPAPRTVEMHGVPVSRKLPRYYRRGQFLFNRSL